MRARRYLSHSLVNSYDGIGLTFPLALQTLLEKIKTIYNKTPGLDPNKIGPTVGQNSESIVSLS